MRSWPWPALSASRTTIRANGADNPDAAALSGLIAASIAIAISAFAGFGGARDARDAGEEADELSAWETFETAFNTLKTRFEKEFPMQVGA